GWSTDPVRYKQCVQSALQALRGAIVQGDPKKADPLDERVRSRAVEVFERVVTHAAPVLARAADSWESLPPDERSAAEVALAVLDTAATEIYFGSGAYARSKREDRGPCA